MTYVQCTQHRDTVIPRYCGIDNCSQQPYCRLYVCLGVSTFLLKNNHLSGLHCNHNAHNSSCQRILTKATLQGTQKNCPFPWGIRAPAQHMVPCTHSSPYPKRHLDQFKIQSFLGFMVVPNRQTHTETARDTHRPQNISNIRLLLCTLCMQYSLTTIMVKSVCKKASLQFQQMPVVKALPDK